MRNDVSTWDEGELRDDNGYIQKPLPSPLVRVPWHIWLEWIDNEEWLMYRWLPWSDDPEQSNHDAPSDHARVRSEGAGSPHLGYRDEKRCIDSFLRLRGDETKSEVIVEYARLWGVLGICRHGLPSTHNPPSTGVEAVGVPHQVIPPIGVKFIPLANGRVSRTDHEGCQVLISDGGHWCEPVSSWRFFAREAYKLVGEAAELHRRQRGNKPPKPEEWMPLMQQAMWWLTVSDARPFVHWNKAKPCVTLGSARMPSASTPDAGWGTLFGLLATQLAFVVSNASGFDECDACHEWRPVERWPRSRGRKWYCSSCRADERSLERERKRRQRASESAQKGGTDAKTKCN